MNLHPVSQVSYLSFTGSNAKGYKVFEPGFSIGLKVDGEHLGGNYIDQFFKEPFLNGDKVHGGLVRHMRCILERGANMSETAGAKEVLELCKNNPDKKIFPVIVCQPNITKGVTSGLEELINKNPNTFKALYFVPDYLIADKIEHYDSYFELARKKGLPAIFLGDFDLAYKLAQKNKDVPVVISHMGLGGREAHEKVLGIILDSIDNKRANVHVNIAYADCLEGGLPSKYPEYVMRLIKELDARGALHRVHFSAEPPTGPFGEKPIGNKTPVAVYEEVLDNLKNAIKKDFPDPSKAKKVTSQVLYDNANELFFKKGLSKGAMGAIGAAGVLLLGGAVYLYNKSKPQPPKKLPKQPQPKKTVNVKA